MIEIIKEQLFLIQKWVPNKIQFSNIEFEKESREYWACRFMINNKKVVFRRAKITPTKIGQFVTLWERIPQGQIAPLNSEDDFEFVMVCVEKDNELGQFVFPKYVLVYNGIVSNKREGGKRGFRVYPPWVEAKNKQAIETQDWQLKYFLSLKKNLINVNKVISLFNLNDN